MKKTLRAAISLFLLLAFASVLCLNPPGTNASPAAEAAAESQSGGGTFRLPASLRVIGEEAFEGTAVSSLILEDEVTAVESRAFAGTQDLREVYIPGSVETLAEDAFDGAGNLTVYGIKGSAAEDWASRLGYRFILRDIWTDALVQRMSQVLAILLLLLAFAAWAANRQKSIRPGIAALAVEFIALCHKKRAELFVRDLCFP